MTVNNLVDPHWRTTPISLEDWKAQCRKSSHCHPGEAVTFRHNERRQMVYAFVRVNEAVSVDIGVYFLSDTYSGVKPNTGWTHT